MQSQAYPEDVRTLAATILLTCAAMTAPSMAGITLVGPTTLPISTLVYPTHAAVGDVDSNGVVDIIVSCRDTTGNMALLRGLGAGVFAPAELIHVGSQTDWVEIRDVNGDGTPDLIASIRSGYGRVAILKGLGGGLFAPPVMILAQRQPAGMIVRDLDGDGDLDVALVNYVSASVEIWKGDGAMHFQLSQIIMTQQWTAGIPYPFCIIAADFDGDGDLDLATSSIGGSQVAIMRNLGSGNFSQGETWRAPPFGDETVSIANLAATDIDKDGDIDIISNGLLLASPNVTVYWINDGSGRFAQKVIRPAGTEGYAWTVNAADMDGDGDDDVLMGSALPGKLTIAEVDGANGGAFVNVTTKSGGSFLRDMTLIDIDNDGDRDVVAVDIAAHKVMIYRNTSGGVADDPPEQPWGTLPKFKNASAASQWFAQWEHAEGSLAGDIPAVCGPGAGPCEEVHDTPGCVRTLCCEAVCNFNPLCCEFQWDQACVDSEEELCDNFNCPSVGACDQFHASVGCENESCCGFLCDFDPFCCYSIWDETCARESPMYCGASACSIGHNPIAIELPEICYQRLDDGCNKVGAGSIAALCGKIYESTISSDVPRDTDWFRLDALGCASAVITFNTEFPLLALVVQGTCDGPLQMRQAFEVEPCSSGSMRVDNAPNSWLVLSAGNLDQVFRGEFPCDIVDPNDPPPDPKDPPFQPGFFGLHYRASFLAGAVAGDINGDGHVDGVDLSILLSGWGGSGPADLNHNGIVDGADLTTLFSNWG